MCICSQTLHHDQCRFFRGCDFFLLCIGRVNFPSVADFNPSFMVLTGFTPVTACWGVPQWPYINANSNITCWFPVSFLRSLYSSCHSITVCCWEICLNIWCTSFLGHCLPLVFFSITISPQACFLSFAFSLWLVLLFY